MSAFILKLLDEAILPAVLVFSLKVSSLVFLARYLKVPFLITSNRLVFDHLPDLVWANNLSNLLLLVLLFTGTGWVLVRLHFFHESHLSPSFLPRILEADLEFAISTSFNLFHQAFIWLSLSTLVTFALFLQALFGLTSPALLVLALGQLIFLMAATVVDFEREVKIEKTDQPSLWIKEIERI